MSRYFLTLGSVAKIGDLQRAELKILELRSRFPGIQSVEVEIDAEEPDTAIATMESTQPLDIFTDYSTILNILKETGMFDGLSIGKI